MEKPVRYLTADTIEDGISAKDLARLLFGTLTYTDAALSRMGPDERALVERNSRPLVVADDPDLGNLNAGGVVLFENPEPALTITLPV